MNSASERKLLEGIKKVVAFNWPMYLWTSAIILCSGVFIILTEGITQLFFALLCSGTLLQLLASLVAVEWAYDWSDLFRWSWLKRALDSANPHPAYIATINAGFDEVSEQIMTLFANSTVDALDFYDPDLNTEPSISRARRLYPSPVPAIRIDSGKWNVDKRYDLLFIMFSAHEIRTQKERIAFFEQVRMHLAPHSKSGNARVILVEHLRNLPNLVVFNIGALHFYPFSTWKSAWSSAGLRMIESFSISPFIEVMVLETNNNE